MSVVTAEGRWCPLESSWRPGAGLGVKEAGPMTLTVLLLETQRFYPPTSTSENPVGPTYLTFLKPKHKTLTFSNAASKYFCSGVKLEP